MLKFSNRFSTMLIPTKRQISVGDDEAISYQYMLKGGYIHQESAGLYSLLPLATRVLENIIHIIKQELQNIHCTQLSMPILQPADVWITSGRFDAYGLEMLKIQDRHKKTLIYSPTNEELITRLLKNTLQSYRELPQYLYQIQWKFRDEIRPRFGLMRGREFLMKDAYSFDMNEESAVQTYAKMLQAYIKIFQRMQLKPIPLKADTGPIGGNLSHEIAIIAEKGETTLYADQRCLNKDTSGMQPMELLEFWNKQYAVTEDVVSKDNFNKIPESSQLKARGIEIGQLFYFGTKYSKVMDFSVLNSHGKKTDVHMGSYGIGITRLLASIIEVFHDEKGIIWPKSVTPFHIILIPMHHKEDVYNYTEKLYHLLQNMRYSVLWDDRDYKRPGEKMYDAELIGIPYQIRIGTRDVEHQTFQLHYRSTPYDQFDQQQNQVLPFDSLHQFHL